MASHLDKYKRAQENAYSTALSEIQAGRKQTHWIWFIFPQIAGLGRSETSAFYALQNRREALEYYEDPLLGPRLIEISGALMQLPESNARQVMGSPDDLKLKSCMTLFASLPGVDPVFRQVLDKYFEGKQDERTLERLTDDG
jgi:uncharacterized protein (DUF1810 family)